VSTKESSVEKESRIRRLSDLPPKRRGELAELAFALKAASLGFSVSKPYGDSDRYDFIVDFGKRIARVQVKSVSGLYRGVYSVSLHHGIHGILCPYTPAEIDFVAVYIFPENAWFIVPGEAFNAKGGIHMYPAERGECGMYDRFREAWCLLACAREGYSGIAPAVERRCGREPGTDDSWRHCPLRCREKL
jgi:hypothetical protein